MPRLLKQKYPKCKVYLPSVKLLENLFGQYKNNWSIWDNPFENMDIVFKNNPSDKKPVKEKVPEIKSPNSIPWINEDEEYCKHLAKFFKGEVE